MSIVCPVCNASNASGTTCRRCKADLSLIVSVLAEHAALLANARELVQRGDIVAAKQAASRAHSLSATPDTAHLLASVLLLAGEPERAYALFTRSEDVR